MKNDLNCIFMGLALFAVSSVQADAGQQPNILLILTDDQGYHDLGCQGVTDFETPNIDRLAASGVRFTDGYVTAPQCGPSRAGLLMGMSQSRFGFTDNNHDPGLPSKGLVQTLPEQLEALGYATGMIGKWHIGYHRDGSDWPSTLAGNNPWERGFDYTLRMTGGSAHYYPYSVAGEKYMTSRKWKPRLQLKEGAGSDPIDLDGLPENTYLTDYFSEQGAEFIRRNTEKPWFLYMAYNAPHTPTVAKPEKLRKYTAIKDKTRQSLAAMMDSLDEGVGHLLEALEETGQTRRTLVWYLSDNGGPTTKNGSRNDPFSGVKGCVHEGGIRVPFIVSWPGTLPEGKVVTDPVISLDILPTSIAAAGGGQVAAVHDGKNLLPWLTGKEPCPNDVLYWTWRGNYSAIRMGVLKETRNRGDTTSVKGQTVPAHIFSDLSENPEELASKALKNPEKKQILSGKLDQWLRQMEIDRKVYTPK